MIKGLAITPPVIGRISIGRVIEKNGQRLPSKDDQFTLTQQVQNKDGWILHPLDEQLRKDQNTEKLRTIPVRMLFNDPELNLRAEYSMFDRKSGRLVCVGNGAQCNRLTSEGMQELECPGSSHCEFGKGGLCKLYGRLTVQVNDEKDLNSFIFRTTGYNSIRVLLARMMYYNALSGGLLAYLPLQLRLRSKSTTMSHRTPIFYVDLEVASDMTLEDAIAEAKARKAQRDELGLDQAALEVAAKNGFANGLAEISDDDIPDIMEEFYPHPLQDEGTTVEAHNLQPVTALKSRLKQHNPQH
ncbi:hydrolase or metal-binding protein [Thalassolituus oleivorans]|uniref:recombination directionality factor n=1 Tax=Thalassolituus oleivorans TaxID=187493 RepID=UPI001CE2AB3F|nr:hydrolase or metal-binding protein [Thalassolituus oleivorans]MCA6127297.1 hypothetical protein [Thalassolituus oleivorans 4BN06-13]